MEIKDQTTTTDVDDKGHEFVSEIEATYTETLSDGTEVSADITTTADADDPTKVESQMTVTETAADGTETVSEYVVNDEGTFKVEEESSAEDAFEAMTGIEIDDNLTAIDPITGNPIDSPTDVYEADSDDEFKTEDTDFVASDDSFAPTYQPTETTDVFSAETPSDSTFGTIDNSYSATPVDDSTFGTGETSDTADSATAETDATEIAEQEAHTQAATDAQNAADEFVASGDYAAAAEARETAENESWEAKDASMLGAYDAQDLTHSAEKQSDAENYEKQEAEFAQGGDYESAKESAQNAAYATNDADSNAGGSDHTGQADSEVTNMDNALWQESISDSDLDNAAYHAEAGNFDAAESSLNSAAEHQGIADNYGDLGEHGGVMADYDSSSEVATGGTYDSSYDSGADMAATSTYDSGTDDV